MPRTRIASRLKSAVKWAIGLAALASAALLAWSYIRAHPEDVPWTKLDLADPVGVFTGRKLAALSDDKAACTALLDKAGIAYADMPPQGEGQCRADNLLRPASGGALTIALQPARVAPSCPVLAGLALWEWRVVTPAARRLLGSRVVRIRHFGSYSCRRIYGRGEGQWSEHATGNAIDIAAFDLADGRRITVQGDWNRDGAEGQFLHEVRDGAGGLFATVLSPDYNAAHADHLHLDQAARGATGWRGCR